MVNRPDTGLPFRAESASTVATQDGAALPTARVFRALHSSEIAHYSPGRASIAWTSASAGSGCPGNLSFQPLWQSGTYRPFFHPLLQIVTTNHASRSRLILFVITPGGCVIAPICNLNGMKGRNRFGL